MAKYRLMQEDEEVRFTATTDFKDLDCHALKDIIKFTGVFKNADELKEYLKKYNLIKTNRALTIKYKYRKKDNNLKYGITYQDGLKFFDEDNMIEFIMQNRTNVEFLETICSHYRNSYVNNYNLFAFKNYIGVLRREQAALDDESEIVKDFEYYVRRFVSNECNRKDDKKIRPNFKGMRDLAMFLIERVKKDETLTTYGMDNTNEFIKYYQNKELQPIEEPKEIQEEPKVKTKKKNKNDFPGQMSLTDFGIN